MYRLWMSLKDAEALNENIAALDKTFADFVTASKDDNSQFMPQGIELL